MTTMLETITRWQDGYLDRMARWEEPVVTYAGKAAGSMAKYVPERPGWSFLAGVPGVTEVVENQLRFRERVVDEQARFTRRLVQAMQPVVARLDPAAAPVHAPAHTATRAPTHARPRAAKTGTPTSRPVSAVRAHAA